MSATTISNAPVNINNNASTTSKPASSVSTVFSAIAAGGSPSGHTLSSPAPARAPASITSPSTPSTPISTTTSQDSSMSNSAVSNGPVCSNYTVPARPKPGRKPATDSPVDKRRAQNRQAQRQFRERKQKKEHDLEQELKEMKEEFAREVDVYKRQIEDLQRRNESLVQDLSKAQQLLAERQASDDCGEPLPKRARRYSNGSLMPLSTAFPDIDINQHAAQNGPLTPPTTQDSKELGGCGNCRDNGECPCVDEVVNISGPITTRPEPTPPQHTPTNPMPFTNTDHSEYEIDFTTPAYTKIAHPHAVLLASVSNQQSQGCEFCTRDGKCICLDRHSPSTSPGRNDKLPPLLSQSSSFSSRRPTMEPIPSMEPGSCVKCQQNPAQRAWCKSLAANSLSRTPTNPIASSPATYSCAEVADIAERQAKKLKKPSKEIRDKFLGEAGRKHTMIGNRRATAVEVDAAGVLTTLSLFKGFDPMDVPTPEGIDDRAEEGRSA
ncbi:hypothetical protein M501DRAFT_989729 [Patellaria atrata CBS 101060]|uniref:BZIP domain-containing protein n=1 Tax=Patellaria atrata CBS 101060 TaxID=1346257 RepID=A0A9P4SEA1_9PEZI|nr:hypothetical protein M501DRAFT_989729 [Patellaria atrata CBS 101060]